MKKVISVLFLFLLGIAATAIGEEEAVSEGRGMGVIAQCGPWVNCNPNPPSFNGVCCRICFIDDLGHNEWVCAKVSADVGFAEEIINNLPTVEEFERAGPTFDKKMMLIGGSAGAECVRYYKDECGKILTGPCVGNVQ